jgi:hypothetical protein
VLTRLQRTHRTNRPSFKRKVHWSASHASDFSSLPIQSYSTLRHVQYSTLCKSFSRSVWQAFVFYIVKMFDSEAEIISCLLVDEEEKKQKKKNERFARKELTFDRVTHYLLL